MSPFAVFSWIIIATLCIASLLGNGFITMLMVLQGLQNRKMSPCDFLLTCLSTSRLLTQLISLVNYFVYFYSSVDRLEMVLFVWVYVNMVSLWSASWLSVFYCVKVCSFSNPFFLWLKSRINLLLPRLLGISTAIFVVSSLPSVFIYFKYNPCNLTVTLPNTYEGEAERSMWIIFRPLQVTFTCINFSINIAASLLLLTSLWRHVRRLRKNDTSVQDLNTQVHLRVMKPLLISLFFYILFIAGMLIIVGGFFQFRTSKSLVSEIMVSIFPTAHSILLIWTNPKLKEVAGHILNIRQRVS